MKYLVTGATGFVGGEITRQLVRAGHEVRAVVRDVNRAKSLVSLGVTLFEGDVTDKDSLREAMMGVDGVFHCAGWYKIVERVRGEAEAVNVQGTREVLELMRELRIPRGVYTSSGAVFSNTRGRTVDETYRFSGAYLSTYERSKGEAHRVAEAMIAQGLPLIIAQPGMIYGPGDTSVVRENLRDFLTGRLPGLPTQSAMCWAHVEDIASAHITMMERGRPGESYIIAGEQSTVVDLFRVAGEVSGRRLPMILPCQFFVAVSKLVKPFDRWLPDTFTSEGLV
jgi:nucleoside-diphosphate-sugar epimerase